MTSAVADAPAPHLFVCALPNAVIGLALPGRVAADAAPGRRVLDAAAARALAEPWLAALEHWLGTGLDPALASGSETAAAQHLLAGHATAHDPAGGARLHVPLSVLRGLRGAPPPALSAWPWRPIVCQLVLDAIALAPIDQQALEADAVLILPASFRAPWTGLLQPVGRNQGVFGVRLPDERGRLCAWADGQRPPTPPAGHCTVRFSQPVAVPLAELLGWAGSAAGPLALPMLMSPGAIALHDNTAAGGRRLAVGHLMPLGAGFGVRLDHRPALASAGAADLAQHPQVSES